MHSLWPQAAFDKQSKVLSLSIALIVGMTTHLVPRIWWWDSGPIWGSQSPVTMSNRPLIGCLCWLTDPRSGKNNNPSSPELLKDKSIRLFFSIKGHEALDRNPGYNTLLLWLIPGDLFSACPHRQFNTLLGLLDSQVALPNSYPNACVPSREAVCTILWWSLVLPGLETNLRPTSWEADTLTTKPSWSGQNYWS